jgi:hypothetical protein
MSKKKDDINQELHMTVKFLAILQGEINCKIDELVKKSKLLREKEKNGEKTNYLLEMISDNLKELQELFIQKKPLLNQVENLKKRN